MRIISGFYKGRRLDLPKGLSLRPTTDMAKESLFNVIRNLLDFEDLVALDLFSGTGNVSYELVSRGAKSVLAIENNMQHVRFIDSVIQKLEIENMRVFRSDVFQFLKTNKNQFDLIFADPPYDMENFDSIPELILSKNILNDEGVLVVEHSKAHDFSKVKGFFDHRNYGSVNFSFFEKPKN